MYGIGYRGSGSYLFGNPATNRLRIQNANTIRVVSASSRDLAETSRDLAETSRDVSAEHARTSRIPRPGIRITRLLYEHPHRGHFERRRLLVLFIPTSWLGRHPSLIFCILPGTLV